MEDKRFNNFNLNDNEVSKILRDYENLIIEKAITNGKRNEDLEQEIRVQIYKTLTKNRKK